jgi:hypothetical protein
VDAEFAMDAESRNRVSYILGNTYT